MGTNQPWSSTEGSQIAGWRWRRRDKKAERARLRAIRTARQFEHSDGRQIIHRRGQKTAWIAAEETVEVVA